MFRQIKQRISDIRILWFAVPFLGNAIFLPALIFGFLPQKGRVKDPVLRGFAWACLAFFAWFALVGLLALPDPKLESGLSRILPFLFFGVVFLRQGPNLTTDFPMIAFAWGAVALFGLVLLEWSFGTSGYRTELLAGNPQFLAPATLPFFYVNLWAGLRCAGATRLLHYIASFLALMVVASFCGARAGLLTAACLAPMHIFFVLRGGNVDMRAKLTHCLSVLGIVLGNFWIAGTWGTTAEKYQKLASWAGGDAAALDTSGQLRLQIWRAAWQAWQDSFLFGHGIQNRFAAVKAYLPADPEKFDFSHPHNLILTLGVGGGLVGLVLGLGLICSVVFFAWRAGRAKTAEFELLVMGAATTLLFGMTNLVLFEGYIAVVTILMLVTPLFLMRSQKP